MALALMGHFQTRSNQLHFSSTAAARTGRHEAVQISLLSVISEPRFHHAVGLRVIRVFFNAYGVIALSSCK